MGVWLEVEDTWHWFAHALPKSCVQRVILAFASQQLTCCANEALCLADLAMSIFLHMGITLTTVTTNRQDASSPLHSTPPHTFLQVYVWTPDVILTGHEQ
ncbi:hypothetical protein CY34DRAFT_803785 [Suillus luteus UH-Slu-Lm8-n1]|uniref:Uncharacterized protein n=1 Tax=Suillus luteus UH-Slu-Lm8-n1 TaxID=930992 RepID=A0A0D0B097_9AGAM|nr:hypothetical protein CY34DRAFT_803785 [Suillus luteus UH-Slu-Lm8-n1]